MATIQSILKFQDKMSSVIDKVANSLDKATKSSDNAQKSIQKLENTANNSTSGLSSMQGKIVTLASAFQLFNQVKGIITSVNSQISEMVRYTQIQTQAEDKLAIITKQRMGLTDDEVRSLYNLASAQQKVGVVGDEATITAMAGLSAFAKEKSSVEALTPAMNNLAVKMYGYNVTAESMDTISRSLGRALQGDVGSLSRLGIKIDDNQKKWLMTLNEEQRAVELSKMITAVTGNMNEEMAKTPFGQMAQANNRLGDSYERLGAILLPLQAKMLEMWSNIVEKIVNNLDTIVPLVITALATVGVAFLTLKAQAIGSAIATAGAWVAATAPFWVIIGVIGLVSVALNKMGISFQQQAENILISINWIITAVKNLIAHIENIGIAIHNAFSKDKWEFKKIEANDFYTNQEKAQKTMNKLSGVASQNRDLLGGTSGKGIKLDDFATSGAGGKALKTKQQGEIEINKEDMKVLHDMATRDYMINYQHQQLTPQLTFPNMVIQETADVDSVIENFVSAVTDLAQSKLTVA